VANNGNTTTLGIETIGSRIGTAGTAAHGEPLGAQTRHLRIADKGERPPIGIGVQKMTQDGGVHAILRRGIARPQATLEILVGGVPGIHQATQGVETKPGRGMERMGATQIRASAAVQILELGVLRHQRMLLGATLLKAMGPCQILTDDPGWRLAHR